MGAFQSNNSRSMIRESLKEILALKSKDWDNFHEMGYEEQYTSLSRTINLEGKSIITVLSGEVIVTARLHAKKKTLILRVLKEGDILFLFPAGFKPEEDEHLAKGLIRNSKFTLQFLSSKAKLTTTVSYYTITIEELLNRKPNLKALNHLSTLVLSDLLSRGHEFYGVPKDVLNCLGPLMNLKRHKANDFLCQRGLQESSVTVAADTAAEKKYLIEDSLPQMDQKLRVVIAGTFVTAPKKDVSLTDNSPAKLQRRHSDNWKEMFVAARKIAPQVSGWLEDDENADGVIPRGSLLGMDNVVFSRPYNLDTIACKKSYGLTGNFSENVLDILFQSDSHLLPQLKQNFAWEIIETICETIPFYSNVDINDRYNLASKVSFGCFDVGETVFCEGDDATHFYVVLGGVMKERKSVDFNHSPEKPIEDQVFSAWDYFGEMAMLGSKKHTTTMTCIATFNSLMTKDSSKLAEFKIKSLSVNVPFEFIVIHPTGRQLLQDFLTKEHSEENSDFYDSVVRFEEMLLIFADQIEHAKAVEAMRSASTVKDNKGKRPSSGGENSTRSRHMSRNHTNLLKSAGDKSYTQTMEFSTQGEVPESKSDSTGTLMIPSLRLRKESDDLSEKLGSMSSRRSSRSPKMSSRAVNDFSDIVSQAKEIVENYIEADAFHCVNISHDLRQETLENYNAWMKLFDFHATKAYAKGAEKIVIETGLDMFMKAKEHICLLLKNDAYPRLKKTMEFKEFIKSFRPKACIKRQTDEFDAYETENLSTKERSSIERSSKAGRVSFDQNDELG